MQVSQADYRTVRVQAGSLSLLLRYSLYQDDEERLPESISCEHLGERAGEQDNVVAYFLAATIRDEIRKTPWGFSVQRQWKILREGRFALAFTIDLPAGDAPPFLFPGAVAGGRAPDSPLRVGETRSACPNGLYLFCRPEGLMVFSDPEPDPAEQGSVALLGRQRHPTEEPAGTRIELRYPDATRLPDRPSRRRRERGAGGLPFLISSGSLERSHRLNVVCASGEVLRERATAAVMERLELPAAAGAPRPPDGARLKAQLDDAVRSCLEQRLVGQDGICGLRSLPGAGTLSARAGCAMALLLLRLHPSDDEQVETALRLADFTLRAQHPDGAFYEEYDLGRGVWQDGRPEGSQSAPVVCAETSACVALSLARIAGLLSRGPRLAGELRGARYLEAARRLGDGLIAAATPLQEIGESLEVDGLASRGAGLGGLTFLELYLELSALVGRDSYRKAWSALRDRFLAQTPRGAASTGPEQEDARQALLRAHLAAVVAAAGPAGAGRPPAGVTLSGPRLHSAQAAFSALLPWIYLNAPLPGAPGPVGALVPALGADELVLGGFRTAYLLLRLDRLLGTKRPLPVLRQLVFQLVACTSQGPIGGRVPLPRGDGSRPEPRPPQASTLLEELLSLHRMLVEFPRLFRVPAPT